MDCSRRDFLIACSQAAGLALVPGSTDALGALPAFHLHPTYRDRTPLERVLQKRVAGSDDFVLEKYHDEIAAILASWKENPLPSIAKVLADDFRGPSFAVVETKALRESPSLEVRRLTFTGAEARPKTAFLDAFQRYLGELSHVITVELQITGIEEIQDGLRTRIRYEVVGAGTDFYREQRSGIWQLHWKRNASGEYELERWRVTDETRCRSTAPFFQDETRHALGANSSYVDQLLRGADYWRTVLDGASHIDIYGHNGISVGDIDGDGLDDLYVCQPAGLPNRLYRNLGDGTFEDVTAISSTGVLENTACALFADLNNNGHQDLIVVRANGPLLFVNDGQGRFTLKPDAFRFANEPQGTFTGAAIADYDRDGWLDIYFCLYVYYQGTDQYKYPTPYYDANNGPPNFLMQNNRDGRFRDATGASGLNANNTRYTFCCGWTDINQDGWPDLYVVNDFGRKNLYRNNGDGTFVDVAPKSGTADVGAGMSVSCFDYDNDGWQDLYVANMWTAAGQRITTQEEFRGSSLAQVRALYHKHAMGNSLLRNGRSGTFEDETVAAKVGMGRWSWSSDAWDFDHDGYLDLYVTNGMISGPIREDLNSFFWRQVVANSPDNPKPAHAYEQGWSAINELIRADYTWSGFERNVFYANNRDGTFSDVSGAVGLDFLEDGRAFALTDFDHDGRLEVFLKNRNGPQLRVLRNVMKDLPPSISFRLRGTKSNRDAIGAAVTIETNVGRQSRMLQAGSGFLSQHGKDIFFGLGEAKGPIRATVRWPSGLLQSIESISPDHLIHVEEGSSSFYAEPFRRAPATASEPQNREQLPDAVETWLLSPVAAPNFRPAGKPALLYLWTSESESCRDDLKAVEQRRQSWAAQDLALHTLDLAASADTAAIYNILYRSLFDRHRDLSLPTSLLVNESGEIVKIYQGPLNTLDVEQDFRRIPKTAAERMEKALPFAGNANTFEFGRNHLSLGSVYFQRGYFEQAETWFQLALRDDPSSAEAHYGLGSVYLKQSKLTEAQASFELAVKLTPSYPDTKQNGWNNLGIIAAQQQHTAEAVTCFSEALRLDPDSLIALQNLGNAYRQEKRWDDARRTLEHALAVGPDEPEVNYSLAMVFAQVEQPDLAYKLLQRALQLRPAYPEAMNNLGVLYLRTQRRDQAVAEFERCIRASPAFDQSYLNLARVYLIEGDREKARLTLLALLKEHPNHPQAQQALEEIK